MSKFMMVTSKNGQAGFTLIEMMIALTVGLFILGALTIVMVSAGSGAKTNDRTSELQTNGRYALDMIRRDVQHAGQAGLTPSDQLSIANFTSSGVSVLNNASGNPDCASGFALTLYQPVTGSDDSNPYSASCIPSASYLQGDIIAVRYADMQNVATVALATVTTPPSFTVSNDIYFRSAYSGGRLFQNNVLSPVQVGNGPMQDQLLKCYVYYISQYTTAGDGIPALYRISLTTGAMTPELVASGIENMQVQYAVVDATGNTQYQDANNITAANWPLVKSVRVWLLARNSTKEPGYVNPTYQMGDVRYTPPADQYRRQLFTTTINMRN